MCAVRNSNLQGPDLNIKLNRSSTLKAIAPPKFYSFLQEQNANLLFCYGGILWSQASCKQNMVQTLINKKKYTSCKNKIFVEQ